MRNGVLWASRGDPFGRNPSKTAGSRGPRAHIPFYRRKIEAKIGVVIDRWEELDKLWKGVDLFAREHSAQVDAILEEVLSLLNRMGAACERFHDALQDLGQIPPPDPPNPRLEHYDRVYALSTVIAPRQLLWYDKLTQPARG